MNTDQDYKDVAPESGVTVGIADDAKMQLQSFVGYEGAPFKEMIDAFRFAVSLALAVNQDDPPALGSRPATTLYNMGTFDNDQVFKEAFQVIAPEAFRQTGLTKLVRTYAEWGIEQMNREMLESGGEFSIPEVIEKLRSRLPANQWGSA
jgi:hypothetical protein